MMNRENAPMIKFPVNSLRGFDVIAGHVDFISTKNGETIVEIRAVNGGIHKFTPRELASIVDHFNA